MFSKLILVISGINTIWEIMNNTLYLMIYVVLCFVGIWRRRINMVHYLFIIYYKYLGDFANSDNNKHTLFTIISDLQLCSCFVIYCKICSLLVNWLKIVSNILILHILRKASNVLINPFYSKVLLILKAKYLLMIPMKLKQ
jgi:hypothetical protein